MDTEMQGSALFPTPDERLACDVQLTFDLAGSRERINAGSVTPTLDLLAFRRELSAFDFLSPKPLAEVISWTLAQLERGIVQITHPRYFGLFNPNPAFPAQCADRIAGAFNPQLASSRTSPVAVDIEAHVIGQLLRRAGLPCEAGGHFTSGGSEANRTALVCALTKADNRFATQGARAFEGPPVFYVSRESHLAWIKIAHESGIGRDAVRLIATDGSGRMRTDALRNAIAQDRKAGLVPVMVVATAGTTGAGMIDPLAGCAAAGREHGIWYHIDAAWGGALIVSDRLRGVLAGLELADSITIDAHKWFAATMGCGMFLAAQPSVLPAAFQVLASYMPPAGAAADPYVNSSQWSRRFAGLRLFLSLAAGGWDGYAQHVEKSVTLAIYLAEKLERLGWRVVNEPLLAVVCVLPPRGGEVRRIVDKVLASGRAWVSAAKFEGQDVLRACVTHGETTRDDVDELILALQAAL